MHSFLFITSLSILSALTEIDSELIVIMGGKFMNRFDMDLAELGYLILLRAIVQVTMMLIFGTLVDRGHSRRKLLITTLWIWIMGNFFTGLCFNKLQLFLLRIITGFALGAFLPIVHSLMIDFYPKKNLGTAFGWIGFYTGLGGSFIAILGVAIENLNFTQGLIESWRQVYFILCILGVVLLLVVSSLEELKSIPPAGTAKDRINRMPGLSSSSSSSNVLEIQQQDTSHQGVIKSLKYLMKIPTFRALCIRNAFDGIPFNSNSLFFLWFVYIGMSKSESSVTVGAIIVGGALSSIFGGYFADYLVQKQERKVQLAKLKLSGSESHNNISGGFEHIYVRNSGGAQEEGYSEDHSLIADEEVDLRNEIWKLKTCRLRVGQCTSLMSILFCCIFFIFVPRPQYGMGLFTVSPETSMICFIVIGSIYMFMGNSDEQSTDFPLLPEVVLPKYRGTAFSILDMIQCLVSSVSVSLVGFIANFEFGLIQSQNQDSVSDWSESFRINNAVALASALFLVNLVAYFGSLLTYTSMHWTLLNDMEMVESKLLIEVNKKIYS